MKNLKQMLVSSAVALAFSGTAFGTPITIDGVTFNPSNPVDFLGASVDIQQNINPVNGSVSGYGLVTAIDGNSGFCAGCQLTFQFGGYTPNAAAIVPLLNETQVTYTGVWANFYVETG